MTVIANYLAMARGDMLPMR